MNIFSKYSINEASYMINSYIEESFNDLQVECLLVENRSLRESGVGYFTEDSNIVSNMIEKLKTILTNVMNSISAMFDKVVSFIRSLLDKINKSRIKQLDDKFKKYINDIDDKKFSEIVNTSVSKWYDMDTLEKLVAEYHKRNIGMDTNEDKDFADRLIGALYDDSLVIKGAEKTKKYITKDIISNMMFGGFKDMYDRTIKLRNIASGYFKNTIRALNNKTLLKDAGDNDRNDAIKSLKILAKGSSDLCKKSCSYIIYDSKILYNVCKKIESECKKNNKDSIGESVDWLAVF